VKQGEEAQRQGQKWSCLFCLFGNHQFPDRLTIASRCMLQEEFILTLSVNSNADEAAKKVPGWK